VVIKVPEQSIVMNLNQGAKQMKHIIAFITLAILLGYLGIFAERSANLISSYRSNQADIITMIGDK